MSHGKKQLSVCLLALAAAFSVVPIQGVWAETASVLGAASGFSVLGGTNVTCTSGVVAGDVGVSPGSAVPFTNTGCTITGSVPPATDPAAVDARTDFLDAYAGLQLLSNSCTWVPGNLAGENLAPGVYCTDAAAKAGTLTLTGPADGVWIFLVDGALTGTDFSVVMADGGQPCNVFWATGAAATMTTSAFKGNILAGDATLGSITLTGGTLAGRALANVAVTMTDASVIGCDALSGSSPSCKKGWKHDEDEDADEDEDEDEDDGRGHKGGNR